MEAARAGLRRVLVIDDDPGLIALISDGLSLLGGYEVVEATDGAIGLERFFEATPDCVVVDVRMPNLNGHQFVRALRGDPETAHTPIVVLSAMVQEYDEIGGMLTGADFYLFKPVRMTELIGAIDRAVQLSVEQRRQRQQFLSGGASGK